MRQAGHEEREMKKKTLCERCQCKSCKMQKKINRGMYNWVVSNLAMQIWYDSLKESKIIKGRK